jgi:hypothetical protein
VSKEVREYLALLGNKWSTAFVAGAIACLPTFGIIDMYQLAPRTP